MEEIFRNGSSHPLKIRAGFFTMENDKALGPSLDLRSLGNTTVSSVMHFHWAVPAVKMLDQATCRVIQNELAIPIWNTNLSSSSFFNKNRGGIKR